MIDLTVNKGEVLRRCFHVCSPNRNDLLVITSAAWQLIDAATGETVEHGTCEIVGNKLYVLTPFTAAGEFILRCVAEIPPEVKICNARVRVLDGTEAG